MFDPAQVTRMNLDVYRQIWAEETPKPLTPKSVRTSSFGLKPKAAAEVSPESSRFKPSRSPARRVWIYNRRQNASEVIKNLQTINGISIEELERRMRPSIMSEDGFLGQNESLIGILVEDNDFVIEAGLTHQRLAQELNYVAHAPSSSDGLLIRSDAVLEIATIGSFGIQSSPFEDGTSHCSDFIVRNRTNGKVCCFSGLHIEMIGRYGFYEGRETGYRVEPKEIIETFNYLSDPVKA